MKIENSAMWLWLALLGHLLNAFVYLSDKAFVVKLYPSPTALAFISGISGVVLFVAFPWYLKPAPYDVILASVGSGLISIPALLCFFKAMQKDEVSRVVPAVGSLMPLFTFSLSYWILAERLIDVSLAAFTLLVLGGMVIAFRSFAFSFLQHMYSTLFLEVAAAFLFSLMFILQKYAFEGTDDFSAFLWSRIGAAGAAFPFLFSVEVQEKLKFLDPRRSGVMNSFQKGTLFIVTRIFSGISPLIILLAITYGSATLVNALQGLQYIFLFMLAILFSRRWPDIFHEEMSLAVIVQKGVATVMIMTGLALLMQ